jgi:hypothetical protein
MKEDSRPDQSERIGIFRSPEMKVMEGSSFAGMVMVQNPPLKQLGHIGATCRGYQIQQFRYGNDVVHAMFEEVKGDHTMPYAENTIPGVIFATDTDIGPSEKKLGYLGVHG